MFQKSSSLKDIAEEMMSHPTKVIGGVFKQHEKYIKQREGEKALQKVKQKMAELGYPVDFDEIKNFQFYPVGLSDLVIVVAKEVLGWSKEDVFDMGNCAPKLSILVKTFAKYFLSLEKTIKKAQTFWRRHFSRGEVEYELHKEENYLVLRLKHENTHPLICTFLSGYFLGVAQYVISSSNMTAKEEKCMFEGDPYHEFVIRWE